MSEAAGFYDIGTVHIRLAGPGGTVELGNGSGLSEGEGFKIEPVNDASFYEIGADGFMALSQNPSTAHLLTGVFSKLSPVNNILQIMASLQRADSSLFGQNALVITDTLRKSLITCTTVAFLKWAPLQFAQKAGTNEWQFIAGAVQRVAI